ncbi:MAG: CPBP family intramembrane glutamic endopeptidase [Planctomycetota bacterium]
MPDRPPRSALTPPPPPSAINQQPSITNYWERSRWPLQSLYFLLPLLVIYELGASTYLWDRGQQHTAHRLMVHWLDWFGVTGRHLPALVVVGTLIGMHVYRRRAGGEHDAWRPEPKLYLAMAFETVILSLPLFVFMSAMFRSPMPGVAGLSDLQQFFTGDTFEQWKGYVVVSIGAGVYEELLFRLFAIGLVKLIATEWFALPDEVSTGSAVVLSSLGFAFIHFAGGQEFDVARFLFYFVTGLYFGAVYLGRGFGMAVATHTFYDVLIFSKYLYQQ